MAEKKHIHAAVDRLLLEQNHYCPLALLLETGRLPYTGYEAWCCGRIKLLDKVIAGNREQTMALLETDQTQLAELAGRVPFMQGAEYITAEWLEDCWRRLHGFFQAQLRFFRGSLEDFFHRYAPDIHLLGKIYFHLVENKGNDAYPFAFMATYAHGINTHGALQHKPLKYALTEHVEKSTLSDGDGRDNKLTAVDRKPESAAPTACAIDCYRVALDFGLIAVFSR